MLLFLICLAFYCFCLISADITMILVWGEPDDLSQCDNIGIQSFTNCYNLCYYDSICVIAYMNENDNICYSCPYGDVNSVTQKTYQDGMKTGIKLNNNSTNCQTEYPVEGQIDNGYLEPNGQQISTYQSYFSNGVWTITYTNASCPTDWKLFIRQKGPWCVMVVAGTTGYNWTAANSQCQLLNGTLSGIENSQEYVYMNQTAVSTWKGTLGYLWVGAQIKAECTLPSWNTTICNNTKTIYEWTDNFTTGTDGFNYWSSYQPDLSVDKTKGIRQACSVLVMSSSSLSNKGMMDDAYCDYGVYTSSVSGTTYYAWSYVCGKQPQ